jgi:hypothetical protein
MDTREPNDLPRCDTIQKIEVDGYFLTHTIWRNSYGSYQPETGVRTRAADFKDFHLIQHNSDDWPMVTRVIIKAESKGWHSYKTAKLIEWLHRRKRQHAMRRAISPSKRSETEGQ